MGKCWPIQSSQSGSRTARYILWQERQQWAQIFLQYDSDQSKCISCKAHTKDIDYNNQQRIMAFISLQATLKDFMNDTVLHPK